MRALTSLRLDDGVLALLGPHHDLVVHDAHVLTPVAPVLGQHVREPQVPCGAESACV